MTQQQPEGQDAAATAETSLTYEQARDELADVVRRLEAGNATLEESLALWERGEKLASICEEWLGGVRARLAAATAQDDPGGQDEQGQERPSGEG